MVWKRILSTSSCSAPQGFPSLPVCTSSSFFSYLQKLACYLCIYFLVCDSHYVYPYSPPLFTSIIDFKTHNLLVSPASSCFSPSLSVLSFFCLCFYNIYLCCFHVCLFPSRAVKVYCISLSLGKF